MRIRILSDLHVDSAPVVLPPVKADVIVLAGDIRPGKGALAWIKANFPEQPVVYVLGNHEFYGSPLTSSFSFTDYVHLMGITQLSLIAGPRCRPPVLRCQAKADKVQPH